MATKKRNSKVAKGAFKDANIQYFGETVVIWNVREFMSVTKWREDAVRRSKRKVDSCVGDDVVERRSKKRGRKSIDGDDDNNNNNTVDIVESMASNKPTKKKTRRKKFAETWLVLSNKDKEASHTTNISIYQ
eukprot:scaffold12_cov128-Skeletonema_dohrnii-CCMP3373.AAC.5